MESELTIMLKGIKQKTGIDVDAYTETLKFSATTRSQVDLTMPSTKEFKEVFCDVERGKTFFKFKFRNAKLIGSIKGCGQTEKNYAYLIMTLIENNSNKDDNLNKNEKLKKILYGDYNHQQTQKYMRENGILDESCCVLSISCETGKTQDVLSYLENAIGEKNNVILTDEMTCTVIAFTDKEHEFAENLYKSILKNTCISVRIGVGCVVKSLIDINTSFIQASATNRLIDLFPKKNSIIYFKDYVLIKVLEDIPKFKLDEYLNMLIGSEGKEIFNDSDMLLTAEALLNNDLNLSSASRELYMHRNTLMYRLDKIEKATGLNIKSFPDAVTFRLITIIQKLLTKIN